MNVIEVNNLNKHFGSLHAVKELSFGVEEGSLFAFLGENGAGKSTTINILCSILSKDSGTVTIDGFDLDRAAEKTKSRIGVVFQNSVLDRFLSVRENLLARAALYGLSGAAAKERVEFVSEVFELGELMERRYGRLSGGQKRRTDIARALLNRPKILFMDEPTTGLDPQTRQKVWEVVERLRTENSLTVFLTTHYMEEAAEADDVVILDEGRIVEHGAPDDLKARLTSDILRVLGPQNSALEAALAKENLKFVYRNAAYDVTVSSSFEAADFAMKHKKLVPDFEVKKGDMDDVFLRVTGKKLEA